MDRLLLVATLLAAGCVLTGSPAEVPVTDGAACSAAATVDWCHADGDTFTYCSGGFGYTVMCSSYCASRGYNIGYCESHPGDDVCVCSP